LTNLPIYSSSNENLLFLFGEAYIKYMCAIVSTHNLIDMFNLEDLKLKKIERRTYKEIIHEIGHLILDCCHCLNDYCVMHFSKNIKDIDSKSIYLCEKCKVKLEKVRERNNF
jgi:archaemetzincin